MSKSSVTASIEESLSKHSELDNNNNDDDKKTSESERKSIDTKGETVEFHDVQEDDFGDNKSQPQNNLHQLGVQSNVSQSTISIVTNDIQILTASFNKLSFDIYKLIMAKLNKNLVFSPFSIENLLTMCYLCSQDTFKNELGKILHLSKNDNDDLILEMKKLKETIVILLNLLSKIAGTNSDTSSINLQSRVSQHSIISTISTINSDLKLIQSNSVYCREDYLLKKFQDILEEIFQTEHFSEKFEPESSEESLNQINLKTRSITRKNINEMFLNETFNQNVYMLLINTLHFEGRWSFKFDDEFKIGRCLVKENKYIEACLMTAPELRLMYVNKPNNLPCRVCEFPFANDSFVFTILLPEPGHFEHIESLLTYELFDDFINQLAPRRVNILLPKFQIYDHLDLKELFDVLGAPSLVDFSKVNEGLGINRAVYKSYIRLCEKGIEASSCTSFSLSHEDIKYDNVYSSHPCEDLICNKPFLLYVREKNTRIILFMGKVVVPE